MLYLQSSLLFTVKIINHSGGMELLFNNEKLITLTDLEAKTACPAPTMKDLIHYMGHTLLQAKDSRDLFLQGETV